jgi:hypothetical protein
MTVRTISAFDPTTAARLERLARQWGISKSMNLLASMNLPEINNRPLD